MSNTEEYIRDLEEELEYIKQRFDSPESRGSKELEEEIRKLKEQQE